MVTLIEMAALAIRAMLHVIKIVIFNGYLLSEFNSYPLSSLQKKPADL